MTTDLTPYRALDLGTVGEPAALVDKPIGPVTLPPQPPKPSKRQAVDTAGSLTLIAGALTGLAFHAGSSPELVIYPVGASIAAMVIAAVVHLRSMPKVAR
ncbi:hypothetical protein ACWT_5833 [Actinoplanes sp. SE50]|uniref:hypothetical protein n=1 Tax=unclassified Actinoplanes TaxID=2626549 RepID=UPI00023EBC24|nr:MULTISPECIES: hypothetical protein [unclassified Actinoplanes]AEV86851.1 hypothetical protein ACPL_5964 [Actinoplanes sp. SE50/110]ATO85248.1 hypothetical protein ACWT_5833 [Actinoplanes sp. SE50]SLM02658.1 hypothetical protein ACSP50_5940 [Actinoplanes sp. SE50/110]